MTHGMWVCLPTTLVRNREIIDTLSPPFVARLNWTRALISGRMDKRTPRERTTNVGPRLAQVDFVGDFKIIRINQELFDVLICDL